MSMLQAATPAASNGTRGRTHSSLEARFDTAGWGLLSLLLAGVALPNGTGEYLAVAGVGALMLGLNAARLAARVEVRWFSVVLGSVAVISGAGAMAGVKINDVALLFALFGVALIADAVIRPVASDPE